MDMNLEQNTQENTHFPEETMLDAMLNADGWVTKLLTPIRKVNITSQRLADAFRDFVRSIRVGDTFTLTGLLTATELIANRKDLRGVPGDGIYMLTAPVTDVRLRETLLTRSAPGLCALLQACDGAELRVPNGMTAERMLGERFYVLRSRDGDRICRSGVGTAVRVGTVTPEVFKLTGESGDSATRSLSALFQTQPVELTVGSAEEPYYTLGFHAALAYSCGCFLRGAYYVNLASDLPLSGMLAAALGMFDAMLHYRLRQPPMRFQPNGRIGLMVPRPTVGVGDTLYAFRPKCDTNGVPFPGEVMKLRHYLESNVAEGKIKGILPLKKNALDMVCRLGGEELVYCQDAPMPTDGFAMLAIFPPRAETPGTKLGSYQLK